MITEFINKIKKVHNKRKHKINHSVGVYDSYKWLRRNKWLDIPRPIKEKEFYTIIRKVNNYLAEELAKGNDVTLPCRMGILEIRKKPVTLKYENGKLITSRPVNWDATLKLWYEDEYSFKNKTLVREESKEVFQLHYNKCKAEYTNKSFYDFSTNRDIKLRLKDKIKNKELDAFKLYEYME